MAGLDGRWLPTSIEGAMSCHLDTRADVRGSFSELWRHSWTEALGLRFTQVNLSTSSPGVLRGLHFHQRQTDLWILLEGSAHVALVDLRPVLGTTRQLQDVGSLALDMVAGDGLVIPPGVAHGFLARDAVRLLYLVTNEYDGTDEHGFAWDDPIAAIAWPTTSPTLSERDAAAPSLVDALNAFNPSR